jgi:hypothetical protein
MGQCEDSEKYGERFNMKTLRTIVPGLLACALAGRPALAQEAGTSAPTSPVAPPVVEADARVSFVASPGVSFYRLDPGAAPPARLCLAPCRLHENGESQFALSLEGREPIRAPEKVTLSPGTVVEGEYLSKALSRNAGLIVIGVVLTAGLGTVVYGVGSAAEGANEQSAAPLIVGGAVEAVTSLIIGLALALAGDEVHVHTRSGTP